MLEGHSLILSVTTVTFLPWLIARTHLVLCITVGLTYYSVM